jgi:catechol 2,3-dioxygenase-like lactoylglutathione lyase family enzyme
MAYVSREPMPTKSRRRIALDHVVLEVRNAPAAVAFYGALLELAPVRLAAFRANRAPFPSVRIGPGTMIDFFPRKMWRDKRQPRNPNHLSFALGRRAEQSLRRRLVRAGVPIEREMQRNFGARGWGGAIYFSDPEGNTVEVRCYGPPAPAGRAARPRAR